MQCLLIAFFQFMLRVLSSVSVNIQLYQYNLWDESNMAEITIYTTKTCPKCEQLKNLLESKGVPFNVSDMSTPQALTELKVNGVFTMTAPVLQINDDFLTHKDLFNGSDVNLESLSSIL